MSLNLTSRFYPDTRDFAVLDRNPADVAAIASVFDADFRNAKVASTAGTGLIWSPRQSGPALLALIDGATSSLLVENEELAYPAITAALSRAARRGVRVVVVMTDATQWHDAFAKLIAAGVAVRIYAQQAPLYIHAKVVVADIGTPRQRAFMGSENFSAASLNHNRELGVQTADRTVVTGLATVIEGDATAAATWRP
jgi:cardiolipin synthase A/B